MDRSNRVAILEPIILILKQRTGIATILGVIVTIAMHLNNFSTEEVVSVVALILTYVGKQTYLDSIEMSNVLIEEVVDVVDIVNKPSEEVEVFEAAILK